MILLEQVEKLREKSGVGYEDARAALEASGGDMLEAMIWLETRGKLTGPSGCYRSNAAPDEKGPSETAPPPEAPKGESFGQMVNRFLRWCGRIIHRGNTNYLDVYKKDERVITLPITALVLLLLFAFWIVVPLMIVGLFCGFRFWVRGNELGREDINRAMGKASDAADNLRKDMKESFDSHSNKNNGQ